MALQQLSVFLENREGRLEDLFNVFRENEIEVHSFSLAESSEYGILRLIVSDPEKAKEKIRSKNFSASVTSVTGVKLSNGFVDLFQVTKVLPNVNIEYMYVLSTEGEKQSIIFKTRNVEETEKALMDAGFEVIS